MKKQWWQDKTAYQIYPKSFYDSNGDGIGDIPGIISKLDYLKSLGADILWLSPVYQSPLADQGYDISDYYKIDPRFGTMEDMEELIRQARKRDMYILMDLVVNHCSDEHEWFQKACQDPDGKYGNFFYIKERDEAGTLPCNWRSYFGGPVWETLPGHPDKQYLHVFHTKQPDLNWENREVREEVYKNIRWWLEKGLGGFRIDAIINIKKKLPFSDYPVDREDGLSDIGNMLLGAEGIGEFLGEMQREAFAPYQAFTVGEVFNLKDEQLKEFIGDGGYFSTMFDFEPTLYGKSGKGWYEAAVDLTPEEYKACIFQSQEKIGNAGMISNILENHDEPRGASHYIKPEDRCEASKKLLAGVYYMLKGIPFIYQGQEIGMENMQFDDFSQIDDIESINQYKVAQDAGYDGDAALKIVSAFSRDNARTPMQWDDSPHAGFTAGTPWLQVNPNYREINAASQEKRKDSLLNFYRKLAVVRKDPAYKDTFVYGNFCPYLREEENLIAYLREGERKVLVLANFRKEPRTVSLPGTCRKVLLDNLEECAAMEIPKGAVHLRGYEYMILDMEF